MTAPAREVPPADPPDRPDLGALEARIFAIERPDPSLLRYYVLVSILSLPALPFVLPYRYFRYHTMRYRFDEEGISMRWGILFRREINLTYARIQDIHLSSNVVERWLGLARIEIQTASGSSKAEMTIEGIREFEELRDYLYSRMRGARGRRRGVPAVSGLASGPPPAAEPPAAAAGEIAAVLREVAAELRAVRAALAARRPGPGAGAGGG